MGSKWKKVKMALVSNLCVYVPTSETDDSPPPPYSGGYSDAALLSPAPVTRPASPSLRLSKSFNRSSKKTCTICLASMKRGEGQAIFTAECSHSFHFHCIASNVKHGNQICPVCRAKWKEVPLQGSAGSGPPLGRTRINPVNWTQDHSVMTLLRPIPPRPNSPRHAASPIFPGPEPSVFNDDEPLDTKISNKPSSENSCLKRVLVKTYTEVPAVPRSSAANDFTVLIHLKAPSSIAGIKSSTHQGPTFNQVSQTPRAPVDLVTVLDTSGSMAGTKLALLKRAMGFVIQNLGPADRLAVIAFSSNARRLFPLRKMSDTGKQQALQAVNSLVANGGTNIAEGLRKGAKVMEDRRENNPVGSIILLSDGQDTYTVNGSSKCGGQKDQSTNYELLLPKSIHGGEGNSGIKIPVHAFGFGTDHDASSMHSISEISGGTFSFIETEGVIQDAFAQCIGGLLSVVVKDARVILKSVNPDVIVRSLKAGSYKNHLMADGKSGCIDVGDLYADEERDFLVSVNIPTELTSNETCLLKVRCHYIDPFTKETVNLETVDVGIRRPENLGNEVAVSIEVDRQKNRLQAAEAMLKARTAAEEGDMAQAIDTLENCRRILSETVSAKSGDRLCVALDAELKEMQERMASRHMYEASGRAYILSGLSSHSWQRATMRGDSTDRSSLVQSYQTPSMVEMVTRSQASLLGSPSAQRLVRPIWSFASPKPR
uniref:E3 ubiquitin-protein ligase WAV3 n=1 Tax=Erigeron canadensis TaxID=72917 RepID=UPI001CB9BA48|nr:E3 ubiquitin-protein ligase WAV3 [Erigeron canadensis]